MKTELNHGNWHMHLAELIETYQPGDTIVVHTPEQVELGRLAAARMKPGIEVLFEVKTDDDFLREHVIVTGLKPVKWRE